MPANQYDFSTLNTKKALAQIRSAQGDLRVAFALGEFDAAVPVVEVLRGKPMTAVTRLKTASFEAGEKPLGVNIKSLEKKKPRAINWGLLSFDPQTHTLNVECEKKGSKKQAKNFRKFFRSLKGTPFWATVKFSKLRANADAVADENEADEANAASFLMQDVDPQIAAIEEDQINGDWIEDGDDAATDPGAPAERQADAPEAQAGETTAQLGTSAPARDPAAIAADAERLANFVIKMADSLPIGKDGPVKELKQLLENLLQSMSPELLLLQLMRSANRDVLREMVTAETKPPLTGEVDIAEVTDALLAVGTNLAQQRGILLGDELPKSIVIREQVRLQWTRAQVEAEKEHGEGAKLDVTSMVQYMTEVFNVGRMDHRALRGFIGLNRTPRVDPNASVDGQTPVAGLPAVLKLWQTVQEGVQTQVQEIKSKADEALAALGDPDGRKTVEDFDGTWNHVHNAVAALRTDEMMTGIRLLAAAANDPKVHERRRSDIEALVDKIIAAAAAGLIGELDRNPLAVQGRIHANVMRSVAETQRLLQQPSMVAAAA